MCVNLDVALGIVGVWSPGMRVVGWRAGDEVDCGVPARDVVLKEGMAHRYASTIWY